MADEQGRGPSQRVAALSLEARLHESTGGQLGRDLPGSFERGGIVLPAQMQEDHAPVRKIRAFVDLQELLHTVELPGIQVGVSAGAQLRIVRIAFERDLAVTLRCLQHAAEPVNVSECAMRLRTVAEALHQPPCMDGNDESFGLMAWRARILAGRSVADTSIWSTRFYCTTLVAARCEVTASRVQRPSFGLAVCADHSATHSTVNNLGILYNRMGEHENAEPTSRELLNGSIVADTCREACRVPAD